MHPFDNQVFHAETRREETPIYYLGGEPASDPAFPLFYIQRAFQTEGKLFQIRPITNAAQLAQVKDHSFLISASPLSQEMTQALKQVLEKGANLLMALPDDKSIAALAELAGIPLAENSNSPARPSGNYALIGSIDFNNPLFAAFADPRYSDFTKIHFWKHRSLPKEMAAHGKTLAGFDSDEPFLLQYQTGKGTIYALASSWIPSDSQLALSSKFVPLLFSMLEQTGWEPQSLQAHLVGDAVHLPEKLFATNSTATLVLPNQEKVEVRKGEAFGRTDLPGIYSVAEDPSIKFVVNIDPAEINTAPMEAETFHNLGLPLTRAAGETHLTEKQAQTALASELESRQKYWRWLIVAALAIFLMETVLSGVYSLRRSSAQAAA
jgi:hypothetical protein